MNDIFYKINDFNDLDSIFEISKIIFPLSENKIGEYYNKEDWIYKIQNGGLLVVVYKENKPIGFVISYVTGKDTLHVWIGGILEKYRGFGFWNGMYNKIEKYAKENNYKRLTLNTYKDKFPVMYKFAIAHGFKSFKTKIKENLEKSYFEKIFGTSHNN